MIYDNVIIHQFTNLPLKCILKVQEQRCILIKNFD